jgi:hypothetical protein
MAQQLTDEIIDAAIEGFTQQRARIDQKIAELRAIRSGQPASSATPEPVPGKRKRFSAASRKKMAVAQKARWAKLKGETEPATATPTASKRKRKMSAAGREAIAEATRKRWEAFRAAKAQQEKAATKTAVKRPKKAIKKAKTTAAAPATA